jgi:hypothetical protein
MKYTYSIVQEQGRTKTIFENESGYHIYFPTMKNMIQNPREYDLKNKAEIKAFDRILTYVKNNFPEELL